MAAPEYLIKLKFGTEIDKAKFRELENAYNKLSQKQRQTFAKQHNSTLQEMDKLFTKQSNKSLKEYEKAAVKTEDIITNARLKGVDRVAIRQKETLKTIGKLAGSALGVGMVAQIAQTGISSSFGLTRWEKNSLSGGLSGGLSGATAGAMLGSAIPGIGTAIGAVAGAIAGAAGNVINAAIENSADKMKNAATLFSQSVSAYRSAQQATSMLDTDFDVSGFEDEGQYIAFRNMLASAGVNNDMFLENLFARIAKMPGLESFGQSLMASRPDAALLELEKRLNEFAGKRGISVKQAITAGAEEGGLLGLGRAGAPLVKLFSGGLQATLDKELESAVRVGLIKPGEDITTVSKSLRQAENIRKRGEIDERWIKVAQAEQLHNLDLNNEILKANQQAFERTKKPMQETGVLLAGLNYTLRAFDKELNAILNEVTKRTGRTTTATQTWIENNGLGYGSSKVGMSQEQIMKDAMTITTEQINTNRSNTFNQTLRQ